jgi:hypothetical protein
MLFSSGAARSTGNTRRRDKLEERSEIEANIDEMEIVKNEDRSVSVSRDGNCFGASVVDIQVGDTVQDGRKTVRERFTGGKLAHTLI